MLLAALSAGEKFSVGGVTSLLGLGMTFIVLVLLIGCIYLMDLIILKIKNIFDKKVQKEHQDIAQNTEVNLTETNVLEEAAQTAINENVMLAITDAVREFSSLDDPDKKEHKDIKIISVTEVK